MTELGLASSACDDNREPLPPGHPLSWGPITAGTCLAQAPYLLPTPGRPSFSDNR
jgi:hypothetical protein